MIKSNSYSIKIVMFYFQYYFRSCVDIWDSEDKSFVGHCEEEQGDQSRAAEGRLGKSESANQKSDLTNERPAKFQMLTLTSDWFR